MNKLTASNSLVLIRISGESFLCTCNTDQRVTFNLSDTNVLTRGSNFQLLFVLSDAYAYN